MRLARNANHAATEIAMTPRGTPTPAPTATPSLESAFGLDVALGLGIGDEFVVAAALDEDEVVLAAGMDVGPVVVVDVDDVVTPTMVTVVADAIE
jgi:hypothetical protein